MDALLILQQLDQMAHSHVDNYVCPGLRSSLIGTRAADGSCIRLFSASRNTAEQYVTPHSHRYDLTCMVLEGEVRNTLFVHNDERSGHGWERDLYAVGHLGGGLGKYTVSHGTTPEDYWRKESIYREGSIYSMTHDEIHTIAFSQGARVLVFEGPNLCEQAMFLEPWVDGGAVHTFKVEPWMFKRHEDIADPEEYS